MLSFMSSRSKYLPEAHDDDDLLDSKPAFVESRSKMSLPLHNEPSGKGITTFKEAPIVPVVIPSNAKLTTMPAQFPHAGVTINTLRRLGDIVAGYDPSMSTTRVVDELVKPWTRKDACSLTDQIFSHYKYTEHPQLKLTSSDAMSATSSVFVCHAWSEVFLDLIGAIESFHDSKSNKLNDSTGADSCSYWIDIFTMNQWRHPTSSPEWIPSTLPAGIEDIGQTCLVLSSSENPIPLRRTWCLWEIYCARKSKSNLTIQLTKNAQSLFIKSFLNDYETTVKRFTDVDFGNSDTTNPADRQKIFEAVRTSNVSWDTSKFSTRGSVSTADDLSSTSSDASFHRVNQTVTGVFREWIRKAVDDELEISAGLSAGAGAKGKSSSSTGLVSQATVKLLVFAARLAADQGRNEDAEPLYRKALESCEVLLGGDHADTLTCINNLAVLLKSLGRMKEAEAMYRRALSGHEQTHGLMHPDTLSCVNNLALLLQDMGKLVEAENLHRRALAGCEELCGHNHTDTLMSVNNLAALLQSSGKLTEAEHMYERAVTGFRTVLGPVHPGTLTAMSNLAYLCRILGQMEKAERLYRQILEGSEASFPATHVRLLAAVNNLALLLQDRRKFEEAEMLCRRAVHGYALTQGPTHAHTLTSVNNLANVLHSQGKLVEAENTYYVALEGYEESVGAEHIHTLTTISNLSLLLVETGKLDEAEKMCRRAATGREKTLGTLHEDSLCSMHNLGMVLRRRNKFEAAETVFKQTMTGRAKVLGPDHVDTLNTVNVLASVLKNLRKFSDAERLFRRAMEGREATLGADHASTLQSINSLAVLLKSLDRPKEAEPLLRKVLESVESTLGQFHADTLTCQSNYAALLKSLGKTNEAVVWYEKSLEGREQVLGSDHADTLTAMNNLAVIMKQLRRMDDAERLYRRALAGRERTLGADHVSTLCSVNNLAALLLAKHVLAVEGDSSLSDSKGLMRTAGSPVMDAVRRQSASPASTHALSSHLHEAVGTVNNIKGKLQSFADLNEVEQLFVTALTGRSKLLGEGHRDTADTAYSLGNLLEMKLDWSGAAEAYSRAYNGYIVSLGPDHEETSNSLARCEDCRKRVVKHLK